MTQRQADRHKPLQNRVLPTGEIVASSARGTLMGNRGILHDGNQRLGASRWTHQAWVTCVLDFKNRRREIMTPRHYTELFFLDEAVALAAGHRPCGECRRADYQSFRAHWNVAHGPVADLKTIDQHMHRDRVNRKRRQVRHSGLLDTLPNGAFILFENHPHLVWNDSLLRYSPHGYIQTLYRPDQIEVVVLTPHATLQVLKVGYVPSIHGSINQTLARELKSKQ